MEVDHVMTDAPSLEPTTPRSLRAPYGHPQQSPHSSSGCPFMRGGHGSPLNNPHSPMSMDPGPIPSHRVPPYDPVHHHDLPWSTTAPTTNSHWQPSFPAFPPLGNRPHPFGQPVYLNAAAPPSFAPWASATPNDAYNPQWMYRAMPDFLSTGPRPEAMSSSMSGSVHGPEQTASSEGGLMEPNQSAPGARVLRYGRPPQLNELETNGSQRPMPQVGQNPTPTLPQPRMPTMPAFGELAGPMASSGWTQIDSARRGPVISSMPMLETPRPEGHTHVHVNQPRASEGNTAATSRLSRGTRPNPEPSRAADHADAQPGSSSDSPSSDDDDDEDFANHEAQARRILEQFELPAHLPNTGREINSEQVRAHQLFRGGLTTKRVATKNALASLQSVEIKSLPEKERMCIICYNDFGVETPEGINEAPLRLPKCQHIFGDHCIKKWFEESDSCPYCRDKVESVPRLQADPRALETFLQVQRRGLAAVEGHGATATQILRVSLATPGAPPQGMPWITNPQAMTRAATSSTPETSTSTATPQVSNEARQNDNDASDRVQGPFPRPGLLGGARGSPSRPNSFSGPHPGRHQFPGHPVHYLDTESPGEFLDYQDTYHRRATGRAHVRASPRYPRRSGVLYRNHVPHAPGGPQYPDHRPEHVRVHSHDEMIQLPRPQGWQGSRQPGSPSTQAPQHSTSVPPAQQAFPNPLNQGVPLATPYTYQSPSQSQQPGTDDGRHRQWD